MPARVPPSSPLSPQALEKADRPLRETLERSPHDATVRVVMTIGEADAPPKAGTAAVRGRSRRPAPPSPRATDRRSLIDARKRELEAAFGDVRRSLRGHGLKVTGGTVTRAIVAEGRAADVARCLDLPQVRRAVLDRECSRVPSRGAPRTRRDAPPAKPRVRPTAVKRPSRRTAAAKRM